MKNIKLMLLIALSAGFASNAQEDKATRIYNLAKQSPCAKCSSEDEMIACLKTTESKNHVAAIFKLKAEFKNPTRIALEKKLYDKYINTQYSGNDDLERNDPMLVAWSKDFYEDETLTLEEKQAFGWLLPDMLLALHKGEGHSKLQALTENKFFEQYLQATNADEQDQIAHNYSDEVLNLTTSKSDLDQNGRFRNFKGWN